jgi:hypothetical protein
MLRYLELIQNPCRLPLYATKNVYYIEKRSVISYCGISQTFPKHLAFRRLHRGSYSVVHGIAHNGFGSSV